MTSLWSLTQENGLHQIFGELFLFSASYEVQGNPHEVAQRFTNVVSTHHHTIQKRIKVNAGNKRINRILSSLTLLLDYEKAEQKEEKINYITSL